MKLAEYRRRFYTNDKFPLRIGSGSIGGKAAGLTDIAASLAEDTKIETDYDLKVSIPSSVVIATDLFDEFMAQNRLYSVAYSDTADDRIAEEFQKASLPARLVGDLRSIVREVHTPLAIRSSSMLEDAIKHPFAGVYVTKMTPNNQPNEDERFRKLVETIKLVYASTFFEGAKRYTSAIGKKSSDEKMAVILQEVAGRRHDVRFYPDISGVARSHNYYPFGHATPTDGVVNLALGLGKAIVDGEPTWSYCPAYPASPAPFNGVNDMLKNTQTGFWSVNMAGLNEYDPTRENEYLRFGTLNEADYDNALHRIASTYDFQSDRIQMGTAGAGPKVVNFAPALGLHNSQINSVIRRVLTLCEHSVGRDVEIEFAITLEKGHGFGGDFSLLQVRPTMDTQADIRIDPDEVNSTRCIGYSNQVMGHGVSSNLQDIVFVRPDTFNPKHSAATAQEIGRINEQLQKEGRPYLLIGYGRWGTSDPWRGIPVMWDQISGAKTIFEMERDGMGFDFSQGSHFFHNMTSFNVSYFFVSKNHGDKLDMNWIEHQHLISEYSFVKHVRLETSLIVKVDSKTGKGVVCRVKR